MPALFGKLLAGTPPTTLGERDGALAPCRGTPNCVSSLATDAGHAIAPIAIEGDAGRAWRRLVDAVGESRGARIVANDGHYLRAEFTSAILGFVDDAEFLLDARAQVIHVRSASRLGRSDFGVNRKRIEHLRALVSVS